MRLLRPLLTSWICRIGCTLVMLPGIAFLYMKLTGQLNPGNISAVHEPGVLIGGFESHASFEKDCKLCHVPVHCLTANRCQQCHREIAEERAAGVGLHAMLPGTDKCQTCHAEHRGPEAVISHMALDNVDHALLTGFSLDLHQTRSDGTPLVCEDCHPHGSYTVERVDCLTCHLSDNEMVVSDHVDRFGGDCLLCHDGYDRMLTFDHSEGFALEGSHIDVACETCHAERIFAGMSEACADCHEEPAYHAGQFGTDCARCHGVVAWAPAQLTQHTFTLDHGGEGEIPCATCHPTTYIAHTCYGCHEHTAELALTQHEDAGVLDAAGATDLEACASCHPTGSQAEMAAWWAQRAGHGMPARSLDSAAGAEVGD